MKKTKEEKLDLLNTQIERLERSLNSADSVSDYFHGGMVGFKCGSSKRKWERGVDKSLDNLGKLKELKAKRDRLLNPLVQSKTKEVDPNTFIIGDLARETFGSIVKIVKVNKKTVTVEFKSGFRDTYKPHLLNKLTTNPKDHE